jgi:hypothetical protein
MYSAPKYSRVFITVLVGVVLAGSAARGATLDRQLEQAMAGTAGPFEVIVTFHDRAHVSSIDALGASCHKLTDLPMAYGRLTREQIARVLEWRTVRSVYLNAPLQYHNHDAGQVTGAHYVQGTLGFKGAGITINVLDSGIDGSREDLFYDSNDPASGKVIQNAKITLNPDGSYTVVEDVQNTDNTSGHGTHVAGTVGGDGTCSAAHPLDPYYYRGAAPESKIVGLGAGETLVILAGLEGFNWTLDNREQYSTRVLTNSWGGAGDFDPDNPISIAAFEAYCAGIVVTFSAGNDGPGNDTLSVYASNPWVIGVAATNDSKVLTDFSSRGTVGDPFEHPFISAPGSGIRSVRAPLTPFGDYQPFVDVNCPVCSICYTSLSGTSMSTPFIAGAVALMLDANPDLSPDQVMDIMCATAEPMAGNQVHEVGCGFVDVRAAVEMALVTEGKLDEFLAGDRKWGSRGFFLEVEQTDPLLGFFGSWSEVADAGASGGSYQAGTFGSATFRTIFFGRSLKIEHPVGPNGGVAQVVVDGQVLKTVDFSNPTLEFGHVTAIPCQENGIHVVDIRGLSGGEYYVDKLHVDYQMLDSDKGVVQETKSFADLVVAPMTNTHTFEVTADAIGIRGELSWPETADCDLYLYDPNNVQLGGATGATLANPEVLSVSPTIPGTYRWEVVGFAGAANYTLDCTQTKLTVSTGTDTPAPRRFELSQCVPNPFNPVTTIRYAVAEAGPVGLVVFDVAGRKVRTLVNESQPPDVYLVEWDGTDDAGRPVASGVYFYRMKARDFTQSRKMVLLK